MSLKLYTDKSEVFECNVSLQGASIKESKLRAILKFDDKSYLDSIGIDFMTSSINFGRIRKLKDKF